MYNKLLFPICALIALSVSTQSADGVQHGTWTINGTLVNVDQGISSSTRCPKANIQIRARSRWSDGRGCVVGFTGECPWGPWWGQTTTQSSGQFSLTSPPFLNTSLKRDILIEFNDLGTWKQLRIVDNVDLSTPHQTVNHNHIFNIGESETSAFDCEVQWNPKRQFRPNPEMFSSSSTLPNIVETSSGTKNKPGNTTGQNFGNIDLEIINTVIRRRTANNRVHPPGRIEWEVTVRNNGTDDYLGTGESITSVHLRLVPNAVFDPRILLSDPIPAGQSRTFFSPTQGNFGNVDELLPNYNVLFTVDRDNVIAETNENNNQQPGCYAPLTEVYTEGECGGQSNYRSGSAHGSKTQHGNRIKRNPNPYFERTR